MHKMAAVFQPNVFQNNVFQLDQPIVVAGAGGGAGDVLQFTRKRWRELRASMAPRRYVKARKHVWVRRLPPPKKRPSQPASQAQSAPVIAEPRSSAAPNLDIATIEALTAEWRARRDQIKQWRSEFAAVEAARRAAQLADDAEVLRLLSS
jgi:hypothetical protein